MKKYIYKITNNINGKIYIGQTNNLQRRKNEHLTGKEPDKLLYHAIKKYGKENFSFECIEDLCEDYNDKEKYWINYYRSYIGYADSNGYNCTMGGEESLIAKGENSHFCTHKDEIVNLVIYYLLETNLSSKEIGELTGYDDTAITKINNGLMRRNDSLSYPLRKKMTIDSLRARADHIIEDLLNSSLTQKEIAEKYGVGRTTITAINNGQNHKRENTNYPIRKSEVKHGGVKAKSVTMLDIKTLEPIQVFDSARAAADYLQKNRGDVITTAIKNNKTCWGYRWKYTEE